MASKPKTNESVKQNEFQKFLVHFDISMKRVVSRIEELELQVASRSQPQPIVCDPKLITFLVRYGLRSGAPKVRTVRAVAYHTNIQPLVSFMAHGTCVFAIPQQDIQSIEVVEE